MALASDLIVEIRQQLGDETATYRWSDAKCVLYLDRGQTDIYNDHPESAITSDTEVATDPPAAISAVGSTIGLRDRYHMALIHYVAWKCFAEDTDDDANIASAKEQKKWYEEALP